MEILILITREMLKISNNLACVPILLTRFTIIFYLRVTREMVGDPSVVCPRNIYNILWVYLPLGTFLKPWALILFKQELQSSAPIWVFWE